MAATLQQPSIAARPLPLRVEPAEDEAWAGYVWRLAHEHGVSIKAIVERCYGRRLKTPSKGVPGLLLLIPGDVDLARIATVTGLHVDRISQLGMRPPSGSLDSTSKPAVAAWNRYGIMRHLSRACMLCLKDTHGVWRREWRIGHVYACRRHEVMLNDRCEVCGQRFFAAGTTELSQWDRWQNGSPPMRLTGTPPPAYECPGFVKGQWCRADLREQAVIDATDDALVAANAMAYQPDNVEWWETVARPLWRAWVGLLQELHRSGMLDHHTISMAELVSYPSTTALFACLAVGMSMEEARNASLTNDHLRRFATRGGGLAEPHGGSLLSKAS